MTKLGRVPSTHLRRLQNRQSPTIGLMRAILHSRITTSRPVHGPSPPNYLYLVAAQSGGVIDDGTVQPGAACNGAQFGAVTVLDAQGHTAAHASCFDFPSLPDRLEEAGIRWNTTSPVEGQCTCCATASIGLPTLYQRTDHYRCPDWRPSSDELDFFGWRRRL